MRVVAGGAFVATCEGRGVRRRLNMMLIGEQPPGTWVLAFIDSAREVLEPDRAEEINAALDELEAVMYADPITTAPEDFP